MSLLNTARSALSNWLYVGGSIGQIARDFEHLDTTTLRRKYNPKSSKNANFLALVRRTYNELLKSNNPLDQRRGKELKDAYDKHYQLHIKKKKQKLVKRKKITQKKPPTQKYPYYWLERTQKNKAYCGVNKYLNQNNYDIVESNCSYHVPSTSSQLLNQFFYSMLSYCSIDLQGNISSRWTYEIHLTTGSVAYSSQRQKYLTLAYQLFDMETDWINLLNKIVSGEFIGADIWVEVIN